MEAVSGEMTGRRAVFLDRDGTINEDHGYVYDRGQLTWIPGAAEAIARLRDSGALIIVVTNQGGVGHGYYSEADVRTLHHYMAGRLQEVGTDVDAWYYCPYHPDAVVPKYRLDADCRKPRPGMIINAAVDHTIDLSQSYLVGDKISDIEAGRRAGVRTILVRTGYGAEHEPAARADRSADSIVEAADIIIDEWSTTP